MNGACIFMQQSISGEPENRVYQPLLIKDQGKHFMS